MADCCTSSYAIVFGERSAAADLRRYRRNGLDKTARRLVDALAPHELSGASIIEVGGGIGAIVVELLTRGSSRAISAEIVRSYESAARELLEERGLRERVERRVLDFARESAEIPRADIVVLHRVVCCYPDARALVAAAAAHAARVLALTLPPDRWWWRFAARAENVYMRLRGNGFRAFVHKPSLIDRVAQDAGLRLRYQHTGLVWQTAIYERAS